MEGGSVDTEVIEDQPAHKEMSGVRQPCILIFDSLAGTFFSFYCKTRLLSWLIYYLYYSILLVVTFILMLYIC